MGSGSEISDLQPQNHLGADNRKDLAAGAVRSYVKNRKWDYALSAFLPMVKNRPDFFSAGRSAM